MSRQSAYCTGYYSGMSLPPLRDETVWLALCDDMQHPPAIATACPGARNAPPSAPLFHPLGQRQHALLPAPSPLAAERSLYCVTCVACPSAVSAINGINKQCVAFPLSPLCLFNNIFFATLIIIRIFVPKKGGINYVIMPNNALQYSIIYIYALLKRKMWKK